jgi:hypothetical protein
VTSSTVVAEPGVAGERQQMAEGILTRLRLTRWARELLDSGYEIGIACQDEGVTANVSLAGSAGAALTARVNVGEWWDPKQLSKEEWSRQLAHALTAALRAAGKRAGINDDRARYEFPSPAHGRLRLQVPLLPGRGFRMAR